MGGSPKQAVREVLLAARRRLSGEERARLSRRIAERLVALELFSRSRTVALYAAMGAEVDTSEVARSAAAAGKRVVFPRFERQHALAFAECSPEALVPASHGTREPPPGAPAVPLAAIDLVLVPGVAFDLHCRRLGRGRGHYDATLAALSPGTARVGLAFELQVLPAVPVEPHDAPLDAVVTEARVLFRLPDAAAAAKSSR
jgi:5-formyltetrahydrofolate cyclo-ligase